MNGERFTDEGKSKYQIYHDILKQPELTCWAVLGSDDPFAPVLEESTSEYVHKADTLEELAEELGILAENLVNTVKEWKLQKQARMKNSILIQAIWL